MALIALAGAALLITDTLDSLEAVGVFALSDGDRTDLLWAIPPFFLLLAFRLREADLPRALDAGHPRARRQTPGWTRCAWAASWRAAP